MKTIKTSKLISQASFSTSITVSPVIGGYKIEYFLKETTPKGKAKRKTIFVDKIIEDEKLPEISNWTVKHLGYNVYKYFKLPNGFYINFYQK